MTPTLKPPTPDDVEYPRVGDLVHTRMISELGPHAAFTLAAGRVTDVQSDGEVRIAQGFHTNRVSSPVEATYVLARTSAGVSAYYTAAAQHLAQHLDRNLTTARVELARLAAELRRAYVIPTPAGLQDGHGRFGGAEAMILRAFYGVPFRSMWHHPTPLGFDLWTLIRGVCARPDTRSACEGIAVLRDDAFATLDAPGNAAVRAVAEVCAERYLTRCGPKRHRTPYGEAEEARASRNLRRLAAVDELLARAIG